MFFIIALKRMYVLIGYKIHHQKADNSPVIENQKLRNAVFYIEGHYSEDIKLSDILIKAGIKHNALTALMKQKFKEITGATPAEFRKQAVKRRKDEIK